MSKRRSIYFPYVASAANREQADEGSITSAESRDKCVNVAADFTSVVGTKRLVRVPDGRKVRRYIHQKVY